LLRTIDLLGVALLWSNIRAIPTLARRALTLWTIGYWWSFPAGPTTVWSRVASTTFFGQLHPFTRCCRWRGICRGRAIGYVGSITTLTWSTITLWAALTKWSVTLRPFATLWPVCAWPSVDEWSVAARSLLRWPTAVVTSNRCAGDWWSVGIEWSVRSVAARPLLRWPTTIVTPRTLPTFAAAIGHAHGHTEVIGSGPVFGAVFEGRQSSQLVGRFEFFAEQAALAALVFTHDGGNPFGIARFGGGDDFLGRFEDFVGGEFFLHTRGRQQHRDGTAQHIGTPYFAGSLGGLYPSTAARHFGLHFDILLVLVGQAAQ
jgi:hypothetical protein